MFFSRAALAYESRVWAAIRRQSNSACRTELTGEVAVYRIGFNAHTTSIHSTATPEARTDVKQEPKDAQFFIIR